MFYARTLWPTVKKNLKHFPGVVLTGPRQSGKTSFLKAYLPAAHYVSLEDPALRLRIGEDPEAWLAQLRFPVIVDEIQNAPELLPYIKMHIDRHDRKPGQWIITGSQNFALMQGVTESLAGRVAVFSLLPLSYAEAHNRGMKSLNVSRWLSQIRSAPPGKLLPMASWIWRGSYPELYKQRRLDKNIWAASYMTTYLERDVRQVLNVGNLRDFERFMRAVAIRSGQMLDLTDLAKDIGIAVPTAAKWLSVLEASYLVFLLPPYFRNLNKRLVKSPKLYFSDTGLATYLMNMPDVNSLLHSPAYGALFETAVVVDLWKRYLHHGESANMYSLRTEDKLEVDVAVDIGGKLSLIEIKSTMTPHPKHAEALLKWKSQLPNDIDRQWVLADVKLDGPLAKDINVYGATRALAA